MSFCYFLTSSFTTKLPSSFYFHFLSSLNINKKFKICFGRGKQNLCSIHWHQKLMGLLSWDYSFNLSEWVLELCLHLILILWDYPFNPSEWVLEWCLHLISIKDISYIMVKLYRSPIYSLCRTCSTILDLEYRYIDLN